MEGYSLRRRHHRDSRRQGQDGKTAHVPDSGQSSAVVPSASPGAKWCRARMEKSFNSSRRWDEGGIQRGRPHRFRETRRTRLSSGLCPNEAKIPSFRNVFPGRAGRILAWSRRRGCPTRESSSNHPSTPGSEELSCCPNVSGPPWSTCFEKAKSYHAARYAF